MSNSKRKAHCGKKKHSTLLGAQIALKRTIANSKKGDPIVTQLSAYKCQYCDGFHVGRSRLKGLNWAAIQAYETALKERCAEMKRLRDSGVMDNPVGFYPADAGSIPAGRATAPRT